MLNYPRPDHREIRSGSVFFLLWLFVLPSLCGTVNGFLLKPLSTGALNFTFYCISFLCTVLIFHRYLRASLALARKQILPVLLWATVGFLGNLAAGQLLNMLFAVLIPGFSNANDRTVIQALQETPVLMSIGVVLLVPIIEETLFRGLLFRGLYSRSAAAAWLISVIAFSLIHVAGFIGTAEPAVLLLNFLQYIPAGLCLCLACRFGGMPSAMLLHALINGAAILTAR